MPRGRRLHAACCIAGPLTGQTHPLLMVSGGLGGESFKALSDVWILDVAQWSWSKVYTIIININFECQCSWTYNEQKT